MTKKKNIPRRLWLQTTRKWYEYSKEYLAEGYIPKLYSCGYCADARNRMPKKDWRLSACPSCIIPKHVCNNEGASFFGGYMAATGDKDRAKRALTIFRAIIKHGEELGYVTGVQKTQIAELERLEAKMFKEV